MLPVDESPLWARLPGEWRLLCGDLARDGYTIEWHNLPASKAFDWAEGMRAGTVEFCLNLEGEVEIGAAKGKKTLQAGGASLISFHHRTQGSLKALRVNGKPHRFLSITFTTEHLRGLTSEHRGVLNPVIRDWLHGKGGKGGAPGFRVRPLVQRDRDYCQSMLEPPVDASVADLWYAGKITEFAAVYLFEPEVGDAEFFCARQKRLAATRVQAVREHIAKRLDEPFDLKKMARDIGCSPFYLSRIFSEFTGMPIGKFRQLLRVRKAAELLKSGRFNVSEASLEVGYNSLSHFSKAFAEVMGCRPSEYSRGE